MIEPGVPVPGESAKAASQAAESVPARPAGRAADSGVAVPVPTAGAGGGAAEPVPARPVPARPAGAGGGAAVTVPALHRNLRGLLYPAALWLLLRGGRKICKGGQACGRLTPFAVPLSADDSWDVLTRPVR